MGMNASAQLDQTTFLQNFCEDQAGKLNVVLSRSTDKSSLRSVPLFAYHSSRTGGIAFQAAIEDGYRTSFALYPIKDPPYIGRVETGMPFDANRACALVVTHAPFGFHKQFSQQNFGLVALFRNPVDRITSIYTKTCMRSGTPVSHDGALKHLEETNDHNGMLCQMRGKALGSDVGPEDLEIVKEMLVRDFVSYCTTEQTPTLIASLYSAFNFPNLIQDIPNRTLSDYKIDKSKVSDEILEKNRFDFELFEFVNSNPKIPELQALSDDVSPYTILAWEVEKQSESKRHVALVSTHILIDVLKETPSLASDIAALGEACRTRTERGT